MAAVSATVVSTWTTSLTARSKGAHPPRPTARVAAAPVCRVDAVTRSKAESSAWGVGQSVFLGRRGGLGLAAQAATGARVVVCEAGDEHPQNGYVVEIMDRVSFDEAIENAGDKLVILDIATKTCGPCRLIYPKLVAMSKQYRDVVFLKIFGDHDSNTRSMMRDWSIRAVPTFRFFRGGKQIHQHGGAKAEELDKAFEKHYKPVQV